MPVSRKASGHKAIVTEVKDEKIHCPICHALIFDMGEGAFDPCEHLVCWLAWEDSGTLHEASELVTVWWEQVVDRAQAQDEVADPRELANCPHIQHVIHQNPKGYGPLLGMGSFGFAAEAEARGPRPKATKHGKLSNKAKGQ